jgi:hypothetical protein
MAGCWKEAAVFKGEGIPDVAFPESERNAILSGTRLVTTRPQPVGEAGGRFIAFSQEFTVVEVTQLPLGLVASVLHRAEGFETRDAFIEYWRQLYPDTEYRSDRVVYFHVFRKTGT